MPEKNIYKKPSLWDSFFKRNNTVTPYLCLMSDKENEDYIKNKLEKFISPAIEKKRKGELNKEAEFKKYLDQTKKNIPDIHYRYIFLLEKVFPKLNYKYIFLLGEAGIGKTTLMQKTFEIFCKTNKADLMAFVYCGDNTDEQIKEINELIKGKYRAKKKFIFIDALDEDKKIRENREESNKRIEKLLKQVDYFNKIFISVRSEYFYAAQQIDLLKSGTKPFQFELKTSDIDEYFVKEYIKLNFTSEDEKQKAESLVETRKTLYNRPLLLTFLKDLINDEKSQNLHFAYQIYDFYIQKWIEEAAKKRLAPKGVTNEVPIQIKAITNEAISLALYTFRNKVEGLKANEFPNLDQYDKDNIFDRSVLIRNEQDLFVFAHQEFRDYFLIKALVEGFVTKKELFENPNQNLQILYEEKISAEIESIKRLDLQKPHNNLRSFYNYNNKEVEKNNLYELIPQLPNDYLIALAIKHKNKIKDLTKNHSFLVLTTRLYELSSDKEKQSVFFKYFLEFEKIKSNLYQYDFEEKSLELRIFLVEYALEQLLKENKTPYRSIATYFNNSFYEMIVFINEYNTVFKTALESIPTLDLSYLYLSEAKWIEFFPKLEWLNLNGNQFDFEVATKEKIEIEPPSILEILNFRKLDSTQTDKLAYRKLRYLSLHNNPLNFHPFFKKLFEDNSEEGFNCLEIVRPIAGLTFVEGGVFTQGKIVTEQEKKDPVLAFQLLFDDSYPSHEVEVENFRIGKYQITVANFEAFIKDEKKTKGEDAYKTDAEKLTLVYQPNPFAKEEDKVKGSLVESKGSVIYTDTIINGKWVNILNENITWADDVKGKKQPNKSCPVIHISWNDAKEYCEWLSKKTGLDIDLPSESHWEYAAKGGKKGKEDNFKYAGSNDLREVGHFSGNVWDELKGAFNVQQVGVKNANQLMLYDMSGNVWEWCNDDYSSEIYKKREGSTHAHAYKYQSDEEQEKEVKKYLELFNSNTNYVNSITIKVMRGGSWSNIPAVCLVAYRNRDYVTYRYYSSGFRICSPSIV